MNIKLLVEHNLEFLSLKGGCTGSSESTHVKMPHCLKSCVMIHIIDDHVHGSNLNKVLVLDFCLFVHQASTECFVETIQL